MKKRICVLCLVLVCLMALSACGCKHETWNEANCTTPKTCAECGETEGEALGHSWMAATCEAPKTCENCALTEGEALGHTWVEADCEHPQTCSVCHITEGEALGHAWADATTESPKTCTTCAATEGERIVTDARFTTAANAHLFGKWAGNVNLPGETLGQGLDAYVDVLPCLYYLDFHNDGTMTMSVGAKDEAQIRDVMTRYTIDLLYAEFAAQGLSKEDADAAMIAAYNMDVAAYVKAQMETYNMNDIFAAMTIDFVYYCEGDQIYLGLGWNMDLEADTYTMEGDILYLPIDAEDPTPFTRVVEE